LTSVANEDAPKKDIVVANLRKSFKTAIRNMGRREWNREMLRNTALPSTPKKKPG
jgi:hypothetical protein